jgi:hypothetical protein
MLFSILRLLYDFVTSALLPQVLSDGVQDTGSQYVNVKPQEHKHDSMTADELCYSLAARTPSYPLGLTIVTLQFVAIVLM